MLDLLIRGADVVDGTGAPRRRADVGVRAGRVVAIGDVDEPASRIVDADGLVLCPGFVDIHTHYDAQALWDPACTPSPFHGVTTVVGGNCGFTIAPIEDSETDYITRMLARVEGMPLESLQAAVKYDWRTFGEYLDRLDGALSVNAGFLVGHSALRRVVMGSDAVGNESTPEQLDAMKRLLAESLAAGGLGFSSSQAPTHNDADGNPVPSRSASRERAGRAVPGRARPPGHDARVHPVGRRVQRARPRAHDRHVARREPAVELERARPQLGPARGRVDDARVGQLRGRARRTRRRPDGARRGALAPLLPVRVRVRRDPRLGEDHGPPARGEDAGARRPGRAAPAAGGGQLARRRRVPGLRELGDLLDRPDLRARERGPPGSATSATSPRSAARSPSMRCSTSCCSTSSGP